MATQDMPRTCDAVVIGGGVIGSSVAYHLAAAGLGQVVLLERDRLGCGTSWHSAANIAIVDVSAQAYIDFYTYSRQQFDALEADTGQSVGWRETGRIQIATTEARLDALRHIKGVADANGVAAEIVDARTAGEHLPILRTDDVLGAMWTPTTGRVNATDLIAAYTKAARKRGAVIVEKAPVTGIETDRDGICAVVTPAGRIATRCAVNCAGLWAPKIAALVGLRLPIHANEHFYILTKPFEGIRPDMPALRDADAAIYGREEVGGLLLGCFEKRAKPIAVDALPADFSFGLLPDDWEQFEPYMEAALHRIPKLAEAEVKMLLNGPESFTPDGKFLLGALPDVAGFYVVAGMNSAGVNFSAGAGRGIAEMVTGKTPSCDLSPFDPSRFARFHSNPAWLRERIAESPGHLYTLGRLGGDFETGRRLRRSPLHGLLEGAGMGFASVSGWERPDLGRAAGESDAAAAEREMGFLCDAVALYDATAAGRFLLPWAPVHDALRVAGAGVEDVAPGECRAVLVPTPGGGGRSRVLLVRADSDRTLVTADAEREASDARLFGLAPQPGVDAARLAASGLAQVLVAGPRAVDLLGDLAPEAAGLGPGAAAAVDMGGAEGCAARLADSGHWLLTLHAEFAARAFERLAAAAADLGGGPVGRRTMERDRVLRAIPAVGREIVPTIPLAALGRQGNVSTAPRLMAAWAAAPLLGGEPLWEGDRPVGFVTSAAAGRDGRAAVIAYLRDAAEAVDVVCRGARNRLAPRTPTGLA
jgi:glycine/D-amino acid oxidase-like deaminating enzyme/glycine cleavage system aminomethyltransferase T